MVVVGGTVVVLVVVGATVVDGSGSVARGWSPSKRITPTTATSAATVSTSPMTLARRISART